MLNIHSGSSNHHVTVATFATPWPWPEPIIISLASTTILDECSYSPYMFDG